MAIWKKVLPSIEALCLSTKGTAVEALGIEYTEFGEDYLTARMPVDKRTVQPYGILHGGASVVLAETVGSLAGYFCLADETKVVVGLDINANHLRPVTKGWVYGTAKPVHLGRMTQVWEILIETEAGKRVCVSRLTLAVTDNPNR